MPARVSPPLVLLLALTAIAYGPSFGAGFLNYDDPWLIENNPYYAEGTWHTPWAVFTDLSRQTRIALGAEYLPLRDLLCWLETRPFGTSAPFMHTVSVLLYLGAVALLRGTLLRTFGAGLGVELAALLFALHPVHAESVAWLAGQKDVLALLLCTGALFTHAGELRHRRFVVPLLVFGACLAKSMSVAVLVLLCAQDFVQKRRFDPWLYALATAVVLFCMALHVHVGRVVGMVTEPAGGTRLTALMTMGPVWLRYLGLAFLPVGTSIAHDVPDRTSWDALSVAGYLVVSLWLLFGISFARRGERIPLYLFVWFFGPLAPVSQVLAPLQNRMTDRYLWLSVLTPALVFGFGVARLDARSFARARTLARGLASLLTALAFGLTLERSILFADDVLLFSDGTRKTVTNTDAPLQLGKAYDDQGRAEDARLAYAEVLRRAPTGPVPDARRAYNASARILARAGRLDEAERLLRTALARFPHDPKVRTNLAKVLRGQGNDREADALLAGLPDEGPDEPVGPSP